MNESFDVNRANWNERADLHAASPDYQVEQFVSQPEHLSEVVRFDLPRLGDIAGLRAVHLQCHIGTDTLSLARLGAQVSGLDFSPASLAQARRLAGRCGATIDYVEASVYDAASVLPTESFDLVYTGIGALNWLPRIDGWARNVAALLKPGGRLFLREGHPLLFALDEDCQDQLVIGHPYFEHTEPTVWQDEHTYVEMTSYSAPALPMSGTTDWAKSLPPCCATACRSARWKSTTAFPGKPCPGRWRLARTASGGCAADASACR